VWSFRAGVIEQILCTEEERGGLAPLRQSCNLNLERNSPQMPILKQKSLSKSLSLSQNDRGSSKVNVYTVNLTFERMWILQITELPVTESTAHDNRLARVRCVSLSDEIDRVIPRSRVLAEVFVLSAR
jgi:hypothetical protein